jgi:hypothetical protein
VRPGGLLLMVVACDPLVPSDMAVVRVVGLAPAMRKALWPAVGGCIVANSPSCQLMHDIVCVEVAPATPNGMLRMLPSGVCLQCTFSFMIQLAASQAPQVYLTIRCTDGDGCVC